MGFSTSLILLHLCSLIWSRLHAALALEVQTSTTRSHKHQGRLAEACVVSVEPGAKDFTIKSHQKGPNKALIWASRNEC